IPFAGVVGLDPGGHLVTWDLYDIDHLDAARARFAELCAERDPLPIPPNAASRAIERIAAVLEGDRAGGRELISADFVFDDRGQRALTGGGIEDWIGSIEFWLSKGGRPTRELIGTRGDRVAILRLMWSGAPGGSEFEVEFIAVNEVDAGGKLRTSI